MSRSDIGRQEAQMDRTKLIEILKTVSEASEKGAARIPEMINQVREITDALGGLSDEDIIAIQNPSQPMSAILLRQSLLIDAYSLETKNLRNSLMIREAKIRGQDTSHITKAMIRDLTKYEEGLDGGRA